MSLSMSAHLLFALALCLSSPLCSAEQVDAGAQQPATTTGLTDRERMLLDRIDKLEQRIAVLENKEGVSSAPATTSPLLPSSPAPASTNPPSEAIEAAAPVSKPSTSLPTLNAGFLDGTTLNVLADVYYGYNFNSPIGRVNLLRPFDVSSNSFSLNQAGVILEHAPDVANGRRLGLRVDLLWGQATQALSGSPGNELRPEIYRNIFQAYGTYVAPIGKGLTIDFGKFSSSLGYEGTYTKDQINYSRAYWYILLPFYHLGVRANYQFSDSFGFTYWLVNGSGQSEDFNGFKDSYFAFHITPRKNISWTVNYYLGQENRDVVFYSNGVPAGAPGNLPTQQGVPFQAIRPAPMGKTHIFDSAISWKTTDRLMVALEGDYVIQRSNANGSPAHADGGAVWSRYRFTPKIAFAGRAEYVSDRGGLFSGATQALKETTVTGDYLFSKGFLARAEWRRDFSNVPYFLTSTPNVLKKEQNTATLGLVWWFGGKQGAW